MRVLVIGGGASGMIAALTAAEFGHSVTLLERQARVGRKLAATGNGRCNLSNSHASPAHYHGAQPEFASFALSNFDVRETRSWFSAHGLLTAEEASGKIYPFSDHAGSVVDTLRLSLEAAGIRLECGSEVQSLYWQEDAFFAQTAERRYAADSVIVACGGIAGGKLGGTDAGYRLLRGFGHTCTKLNPSLVQVKTDPTWVRSLKGVRTPCRIRFEENGSSVCKNEGEIQFTEFGISGPVVFEVSRHAKKGLDAVIDLLPPLDEAALLDMLSSKQKRMAELSADNLLTGILQNQLGRTLVRAAGIPFERKIGSLRANELRKLAALVKHFVLPVEGTLGMDQAQVTAGGIAVSEFDPETMESRLQRGLYACGEVLDIDGDCGGYNLQWAWSSGRLAGMLKGGNVC
ncbi:MAG: NAD(P)/FAD-dependent oxidoreductase [Oscillospiraceae bacterium]|nr:NAD(P)/FAD-dependent oxidoreductase [Oscillospiraceae bacterium]